MFGLAFGFLALTALALALAPAARQGGWGLISNRLAPLAVLPIWGVSAWAVRRVVVQTRPVRDPLLLPIGYLLSGWGTLMIWRLLPAFGARQAGWFLVGTVVLIEILRRPAGLGWLRRYRTLWMAGAILLTGMTLLLGTNPSGGEPHLWLGCCGIYMQPSEPLRLLLIVYLASFLGDRMAWQADHKVPWRSLAPLWVLAGISVALVVAQRDLGTGMLFVGLLAVLAYAIFSEWRILAIAGVLAGAGGILGSLTIGVVGARVQAWLNPWADPSGGAYQVIQSLIALATGGSFGRGPGFGSPGFIPAAHTDFIFASIVEEFGLAGGLALIGLMAILVSRGLRAATRAGNRFALMLAAGVSIGFGLQSLLIMGGVVRLLPLTGVTLPFVSYGGSSLLTSLVGLAFLVDTSGGSYGSARFDTNFLKVQIGFTLGWLALAACLGWWTLVQAPSLVHRLDNPRRAVAERYSPRGDILDRAGRVLAQTVGSRGDYQRRYPDVSAVPVVGYDSAAYGQAGIEASMDSDLRGEAGYDAGTIALSEWLHGTPPPGFDVRLTLDANLQAMAMQTLVGQVGAVVMIDAPTGRVLALASTPSYDANQLDQDWARLTSDPNSPLLNRATQGSYQPGAALTPFVMAWAVQTGMAVPSDVVEDAGEPVRVGENRLACSQPMPVNASSSLGEALRAGCPTPFAALGMALGRVGLSEMATAFGFGDRPAIPLEAVGGSVPVPADDPPDLAAVGQASLVVSPLQVARALAGLMNNGRMPALRLVDALRQPGGDWQALPGKVSAGQGLDVAAANATIAALAAPGGHAIEMSARAVTGSEQTPLAWYLGGDLDPQHPFVVVVVLEGAQPQAAISAGRLLLGLSETGSG